MLVYFWEVLYTCFDLMSIGMDKQNHNKSNYIIFFHLFSFIEAS